MLFSSTVFLFLFLPAVAALCLCVKGSVRPYVLLFASLFFYAWGEPQCVGVLLAVCAVNYAMALGLAGMGQWRRKACLAAALLFDLGVLGYFKYLNFLLDNVNQWCGTDFVARDISMPIGVSFFIFQSMSYCVDVYRRDVPVQRDFSKLALYISFFPQLVAGPIIKYHDIAHDLTENRVVFSDVVYGVRRFIIGLGKKVLIADQLAVIADEIFRVGYAGADIYIAWLGAVSYTLQLFFDFSGYSDMAIGLGRIFGFHYPENFRCPYISCSITEFWRRWHISLSTWFKEYVYIPLGGNRCGKYRTYINLWAVFLLTGIWHGANWTFVLWGLWHGLFIFLERMLGIAVSASRRWLPLRHAYTMLVVVVGWVLFRSENVQEGMGFIQAMLGLASPENMPFALPYYLTRKNVMLLVLAVFLSTPAAARMSALAAGSAWGRACDRLFLMGVLILSIAYLAASTYHPFIYFQF